MSKLFAIGPVEMFEETLEIGGKQVPYFRNDEFSQVVFSASAGLKRLLFNAFLTIFRSKCLQKRKRGKGSFPSVHLREG